MRKVFKWLGILLGSLIGLLIVALVIVYFLSESRLNETYEIEIEPLDVPVEAADVDRGRHLVETVGFCQECHDNDLAGQVMDDDPIVGRLVAPNLTPGEGSVVAELSVEDLIRAIRHGVDEEGHPLMVMPSDYYYHLSDADLAAIIAYLRTLRPVDNDPGEIRFGPLGRLFVVIDPAALPAQVIDHDAPRLETPEPGLTVEYGRYLAHNCTLCHGENLAGVPGEGGGMNLTPAGDLGDWTEAEFIHTIRNGVTPEGEELDPELMPWQSLRKLTDEELGAIWLYLQTIPPVENEETQAGREQRE